MDKNEKKSEQKDVNKKKGFWKGMVEKLDKAMLEKANQSSCCGKDSKGGKCC